MPTTASIAWPAWRFVLCTPSMRTQTFLTEYTKDIEFNVLEANQLKDSGAPAITVRKDALPTANDRKKALGY